MSIKDSYKGNAEHKLIEVKDTVSMLKRSIERKSLSEQQVLERLEILLKDIDQVTFFLSLV
jgi:hypothetical protein